MGDVCRDFRTMSPQKRNKFRQRNPPAPPNALYSAGGGVGVGPLGKEQALYIALHWEFWAPLLCKLQVNEQSL